jgi:phosphohistidine phosphatase
MRHLYILRHAKSGWDDDRIDDHDRPLEARGERACAVMGPLLGRARPLPGLALSSSARRALDTLALVLPHLSPAPPLRIDRELYLASPSEILARLARVEDDYQAVLLVGHNPGLQTLALELSGEGDREALGQLARKLPTAGLVELRFSATRWAEVGAAGGRLMRFVRPRELGAS